MEALAGRFREWLTEHKHDAMPLWLTECGRPWPRGTDRPAAEPDQESALDITMKAVEAAVLIPQLATLAEQTRTGIWSRGPITSSEMGRARAGFGAVVEEREAALAKSLDMHAGVTRASLRDRLPPGFGNSSDQGLISDWHGGVTSACSVLLIKALSREVCPRLGLRDSE
jgi:hypothetical protein